MRLSYIAHHPHPLYVARLGYLSSSLVLYLFAPCAILIAFGLGYGIRRLIRRIRSRGKIAWGDLALAVVQELSTPLLVLGAIYASMRVMALSARYEEAGSKLIFAVAVVVICYFLARVVIVFMRHVALRDPSLERITQPAVFVVRLLFILFAIILILENLGVHLVAVWTTLGVGSVAIALGLQETLSNAFAGFYIMADQPVAPGDYVKLDSGYEGYVVRTGWRATSLRTLGNNVVYVPNSNLAKAIITNYSKPEERMSLTIPVSVAYGTDPSRVEAILLEISRQAARDGIEGLLAHPEPGVRLIPGFGASSLDFSLSVQLRRFADQYLVQSELRKRIIERFSKEGINMPFPTRTILLDPAGLDSVRNRIQKVTGS